MDRRLLLEFLPGIVFVLANFVWTFFAATAAAILAALVAVGLRYRIDGQLPYLALATVVLSVVLFTIGYALDDERFVKIRPTLGGVAFAAILAIGVSLRPSLLERSLGYKIELTPFGWRVLHLSWMGLALTFAAMNELVWRNLTTDQWVLYGAIVGPVSFGLYFAVTWYIAWEFWLEDEDDEEEWEE